MTSKEPTTIFEPEKPNVPDGWDVLPFLEAATVISDQGKRVKHSTYSATGKIPVVDQGQDYIGGYIDDDAMAYDGKLPVILFGDHTRSIKYIDKRFAVGAEGIKILKPAAGYNPKFFYYLLQSLQIPSRGYSRHFQFLKQFHLPIAPADEQKFIVAEIEKQFSRLDEAVANLKRVKANLNRYKSAVLKAAVEGRLVETEAELASREGRSYETGAQLLQRILETRRRQWKGKGKYKEPVTPGTSDSPKLPEGWVWASVEQIALLVTDGDHNPPKRTDVGVPHLTAKHIREWQIEPTECTFISKVDVDRVFKRYRPLAGDLIVTCVGTVGRTAIVPAGYEFSPDRNLAAIRLLPASLNANYLQLALESPEYQKLLRGASGSTAQPHLYLTDLRALLIPLAPRPEQHRIEVEIDRRFSLVREIEGQVDTNLKRAERLRQTILNNAFSGRLSISSIYMS